MSYWEVGSGAIGPDMARPVDFWARVHMVKAMLAALLLVALGLFGSRTWTMVPALPAFFEGGR